MEEIRAWLATQRDYEAGRQLYEQHGENYILKLSFRVGATPYNQEKLALALAELLPAGTVAPAPAANPAPARKDPATAAAPLLGELATKLKHAYQVRSHCHSQLEHVDQQERAALAFQILDIGKEIDGLMAQKQHLEQFGTLPIGAVLPARDLSDRGELVKEIQRLRVRISKHRNKPAKAEEVTQWDELIKQYQQKLNDGAQTD